MNQLKSNRLESLLGSLYQRINYERQSKVASDHFKLQNMRSFLERLGDPHLKYPVVHVAGTKGKGSVTTMIGQILKSSGRCTGIYVSPHLETINQRMIIDGQMITDEQLEHVLAEIEPVAQQLDREAEENDRPKLTFFEMMTAAAFCFFRQQKVEAAVLEVGVGGRLDSTNVCQPLVSVITNVSFDHTRILGSTLDKIAREKAGIIKPKVQVISGVEEPLAAKVISEVATDNGATLSELNRDFGIVTDPHSESFGVQGCISGQSFEIDQIQLSLLGRHQQNNAAVAVAAIEALNLQGWNVPNDQIRSGLAEASLPGRTEVISRQPFVIMDIAHNVASVQALVDTLHMVPEWNSSTRRTLIFATSGDKDVPGMLRPLLNTFERVILTQFQNNPRGKPVEKLVAIAHASCRASADDFESSPRLPEIQVCRQPADAWQAAITGIAHDQTICIAGSAFLVAELRPVVLQWVSGSNSLS